MQPAATTEEQARLQLQRAQALLDLGRHKEALPLITDALRLNPESAEIYCYLAFALRQTGEIKQALVVIEDALRKDPNLEWAHRLRASSFRDLGDFKTALASAREAYRLAPNIWQTGYTLANILLGGLRTYEAQEVASRLLTIAPNNTHVFELLGRIALQLKQLLQAEAHFRESLRHDPQNAHSHNELGRVLLEQGRVAEAVQCFDRALVADPLQQSAQSNMYDGARKLRGQSLLSTSKRALARISPRVYQYYLLREEQSFKVFFFVFLCKIGVPVAAGMALVGFGLNRLLDFDDVSALLWSTVILLIFMMIMARIGWASKYLEVSSDHVHWISTLTAWTLNPFLVLLVGVAGLVWDQDRWGLYIVTAITGLVFSLRLTGRIVRGWYYGHASRLYPSFVRKRTAFEHYLGTSRAGRVLRGVWRVIWRVTKNPLTYIVIGNIGAVFHELWQLVAAGGYIYGLLWLLFRFRNWYERRGTANAGPPK
jgi:tetratricopeptide (TPR) repeat protein